MKTPSEREALCSFLVDWIFWERRGDSRPEVSFCENNGDGAIELGPEDGTVWMLNVTQAYP